MTSQMTHRDRVEATLKGEDTDRPPVSMWRHFFGQETSAEGLAEAMLGFQRAFDWDFMKVNPRASYHAEAWGLKVRYGQTGRPAVVSTPIKGPGDWLHVEPLDPGHGVLGEQLRALELIRDGLADDVPFLMTVFTPLSIASRLAPSEEAFVRDLREHPARVLHALDAITETFIAFGRACMDRGADGLFYATTAWATTERLTREEYLRLARPHDMRVLDGLSGGRFHVLHVCRDRNLLDAVADYPVHAVNWDARGAGNAGLAEGAALLRGRAVVGGLPHARDLVDAEPRELAAEVRGMAVAMGRRRWMLGTGCTFPPETPEANVRAIRQAVDAL